MKKAISFSNIFRVLAFIILSFSYNQTFAQVKYQVNGNVFLEDKIASGTHDSVSVKFFNLPDMTLEDSTLSLADGSYSMNISPGYYLVRWEKSGYVPEELGGLALAADTTLTDLTLTPGEVLEVNGNVSGTWTTSYVYFVKSNIQVPAGYTLTINAGVKVKFADSTNFDAYGTLKILGTDADHVTFTSLAPSPTPGDWGKLKLYAPNNEIKYLDYSWATEGIYGDGASNTVIEHLNIDGSLKLGANGLYFNNSSNVAFKYSSITASGQYGIYISLPQTSYIVGNSITGNYSTAAIWAEYMQTGVIDSNTIVGSPSTGIASNYSSNTSISHNAISANNNGMWLSSGSFYTIVDNNIFNFINYGIRFDGSTNSVCTNNRIITTNGKTSQELVGVFNPSNSAEIEKNYINILNPSTGSVYGVWSAGGTIKNDTIIVRGNYPFVYCVYSSEATIKNNYLEYQNNYSRYYNTNYEYNSAIINSGTYSDSAGISRAIIDSNYIWIKEYGKAIYTGYSNINDNIIKASRNYGTSGIISSSHSTIKNNLIENTESGLRLFGSGTEVESNKIFVKSEALYLNAANVSAKQNLFKATSGDGIYVGNQSNLSLINNTVIVVTDTSQTNNGYALKSEGLSTVEVVNNTFTGFYNGIYVDNSIVNYNIKYNNIWDISGVLYSGTAMPPLIGNFVDQNNNGDPSDIYNNISFNPEFTDVDSSDYTLLPISHLINAGNPAYKDADSTVADIGAYYHHIYVVVEHTELASTSNETGPYVVNAKIFTPSGSAVTAKLFYAVNGGSYSEVSMGSSGSAFSANIPGQALNSTVNYYIEATDGSHTVTSPSDITKQLYSFHVTLFSSFSNLVASSLTDGTIKLTWNRPTPTEGTFLGFKLYKSKVANFTVDDSLLIAALPTDSLSLIDALVKEGDNYNYKLGGLLLINSDTVESVVSEEVAGLSDNATIVRVVGQIMLEGATDYSGIKILFEKASPSSIQDTVFTEANGVLDKVMHVGIYNIHISKDGYKPILLGAQFLSSNTNLDTINMSIGGFISLSGIVSGRLVNSNLYFVDGNVTVPNGDTLLIEAGTEIKFRGNYRFVVNGKFIAVGTETDPIIFTSGMPSPLEGDWGRLVLHNAPNSIIKYCEFYYASNGILLDNCDGTEISYSVFDKHKLGSTGISDSTYDNNGRLTIKNNSFINKFETGINLGDANNSAIDSNLINVSKSGIVLTNCKNLITIEGNEIEGCTDYGISVSFYNYRAGNCKVTDNSVNYGSNSNYPDIGVKIQNSDSSFVKNNSIKALSYISDGVYLYDNYHGVVEKNSIETGSGSYGVLIYNRYYTPLNDLLIRKNRITGFTDGIYNSNRDYVKHTRIDSNYISAVRRGIYNFENCEIVSDTLDAPYNFRQLYNTTLTDNVVRGSSVGTFLDCNSLTVENNSFEGLSNASLFYGSNSNITFKKNVVKYFSRVATNYNQVTSASLINNEFIGTNLTLKGANCSVIKNRFTNGSYINLEGGTDAVVYKNSFINQNIRPGAAITVSDNSNPLINSNLFYNYAAAINAESSLNMLKFNLSYNCGSNFTGSGIPSQAGVIVTVNNNAVPSDIYSNIFVDPLLVRDSTVTPDSTTYTYTYALSSNSPAINAGDIDSTDIDGTIVDIGAYFYNSGYIPTNVKQDSTGDGFIAFSWDITETDTLQGYEPYYKLNTDVIWSALSTTTDKNVTITGLTNNSVYNFKVRAVYTNSFSNYSRVINARPGSATMSVSPHYLIAFQDAGASVTKTIDIANSGNRNLIFRVKDYEEHNLNFNSATIEPDSIFTITDTLMGVTTSIDTVTGEIRGVNISKLIIESDDSESKIDTVNILNVVNMPPSLDAQHFTPVNATNTKFYFVVTSGTLDGELQTGDEIALFANGLCVGAAGFNGLYPFIITAYGGATGNGFAENDSVTIKLWDYGTNAEGKAVVTYNVGDGLFHTAAFAEASFVGTIYELFQLPISPNRFNLVSSYLMPRDMSANNIFGSISGLEIAYEDNGAAFIPKYGINTVVNYDMTEGYHLFTTDSNAVLTITGKRIDVQNYELIIQALRFNSIPYLYDTEMYDSTAFNSIADKIEIVQDDEGGVWIPSLGVNSLGNLKPSKGYQIYLNTTVDVNFTYPVHSGGQLPKQIAKSEIENTSYFKFNKTGISYTIVIKNASFDGRKLVNGDEVGVFSNNVCVGATVWDTSKVNYISAWKGDEDLGVIGYNTGGKIKLRMFTKEFDKEIKGNPLYKSGGEEFFEGAPYSTASIQADAGIIPKEFELSQNYPNPFNPSTTIAYALPKVAKVNLVIYNILGQEVRTLISNQVQKAGRYNIVWNGLNNLNGKISSGVYIIRFNAGDFVSVKKSILLK